MKRRLLCLAFWLGAGGAAAGEEDYINADRPGLADGSAVVGEGRVQVETGLQRDSRRDGTEPVRSTFIPTLLRIGLSESLEARVEGELYVWERRSGAPRAEGAAPLAIGAKYRLREAAGPGQGALGAIVRVSPPSGSKGERTQRTTGDLRLAADWELESGWSFNPNLGAAVHADGDGRRFGAALAALTIGYSPARRLNLFVDAAWQSREAKEGGSGAIYDAGAVYLLGRDVQLDVSAGARGRGRSFPRRFVAAGISVRF